MWVSGGSCSFELDESRVGLQGFHSAQGSVAESPVQSPQPYQHHDFVFTISESMVLSLILDDFRKTRSHYKDALETGTLQVILLSLGELHA